MPGCLQSLGQGCARGAELPKDLLAGRDGYLCSRWDAALSKDPLRPSQHEETPQGAKSKGALQELDSEVVKNSCYLSILPLFLHSIAIAFFTRLFMEKVKLFWLGFRGIYGLSGVIKAQQEIKPSAGNSSAQAGAIQSRDPALPAMDMDLRVSNWESCGNATAIPSSF